MSTFEMLGCTPSKPGADSDARSPEPTISNDSMCANGMMWKSPGWLERGAEGFGGAGAVLMAMALVRLHAVKRVPSSTLLFGAHVILMLWLSAGLSVRGRVLRATYREPTALCKLESASTTSLLAALPTFKFGVAIFPAML